jgi:Zn-dependent protease with chaperone function
MKRHINLLVLSMVLACGLASAPTSAAGDENVELEGYAEWHRDGEPNLFIVDGQRVLVPESVKFKGEGHAFDVGVIPLGYEMLVKGVRLADGSILAHELRAKPNGNAFMEGTLRSEFDQLEAQFRHRGHVYMSEEDYGELWESGEEVDRVRAITARLAPPYMHPEDLRVYVIDNSEWNAMAAPNGSIYVFRGLLEDMDDDEVAIVLGHELAHVSHEHSRRHFKRNLIFSAISTGAFVAADQIDNDAARIAVKGATVAGTLAWTNGYGRSREDQADRVGLRYAYEGGYDVTKGPALWKRFEKKYGGLPKAVNFFLGNHSVAADRAANLEKELARNYSAD